MDTFHNAQGVKHLLRMILTLLLPISVFTNSIPFSRPLNSNLQCFSCHNARTNEECNRNLVTCLASQQSCQTEIRVWSTKDEFDVRISKGCKQTHACLNNEKQNYRPSWPITQCNNVEDTPLSVCRHCCATPGCNGDMDQRTCSPLDVPANGKSFCSYSQEFKTDVCDFECNKCFKLNGSSQRMCMEDEIWSGEEAQCVYDTDCDVCDIKMTEPPRNGGVKCTDLNKFGSVCSFVCDNGYDLFGQKSITCDITSKEWNFARARCFLTEKTQVVECPNLNVENGEVSCSTAGIPVVDTTCKITCDTCYRVDGPTSRRCLDSTSWSGEQTTCVYDPMSDVNCPASYCDTNMLIEPEYVIMDCTDGARLGSRCSFFCQDGYEVFGNKASTCISDTRQWDNEKPVCQLMVCEALPPPVILLGNGTSSCTKESRVGSVCSFSCDKGFTLQGSDELVCDEQTRLWVGDLPHCKQDCHALAVPTIDETNCECRTGFEGDGYNLCADIDECLFTLLSGCHEHATCENTVGSFDCTCNPGYRGNGFTCVDINECIEGLDDCSTPDEGGMCVNLPGTFSCTCAPEYTGNGRNCTKIDLPCPAHDLLDGLYCFRYMVVDPEHPSFTASDACANIESGHPALIRTQEDYETLNAILLNKLIPENDMKTVILGPWIGLDNRYETGVLRWRDGSVLSPYDYQMWGDKPPKIGNQREPVCVHLVSDPGRFGTRDFKWVELQCNEFARYVCDSEKAIEQISLCQPALAGLPNGDVSCTDGWRNGSRCTFTCKPGFTLLGPSDTVQCVAPYMAWDNILPVCVESVCPNVAVPSGGSVQCTDGHKVGSVCHYSCHDGFKLSGNAMVTCEDNLDWSGRKPCCLDQCPPKAKLNLVFVVDRSSSIGATNFQTILTFVEAMYKSFEISSVFTQVSLVGFDSTVFVPNDTLWHTNEASVQLSLQQLTYTGKGTLAGQALKFVAANLSGMRSDEGVPTVVVVLTDGNAKDDLRNAAKQLRDSKTHVIAIGITGSHLQDLSLIASKPISDNTYSLAEVSDINEVVGNVADKVCSVQC